MTGLAELPTASRCVVLLDLGKVSSRRTGLSRSQLVRGTPRPSLKLSTTTSSRQPTRWLWLHRLERHASPWFGRLLCSERNKSTTNHEQGHSLGIEPYLQIANSTKSSTKMKASGDNPVGTLRVNNRSCSRLDQKGDLGPPVRPR